MKTLNEIRAVKSRKEEDLLALPGVTGVDVGRKIVKGERTDEMSIRVYVKKKKKKVPEGQRVPEEIDGVKTDVIEATFELHDSATLAVEDIEVKADTGTYDPLVGGISLGPCGAVGGFVYTGTLGCMVKDRDTDEIMMMTNYHVIAEKWSTGEQVCQPSRVDTGSCPSDVVGALVRSVISQNVDGAVASISGRNHQCSIHEIGNVKGKATAAVDMEVRKRGRTTGLTHGIVDSIDATVTVPYDHGNQILQNQIIINVDSSKSTQFGNSGDSGSVVVNADNRVVGLYFAGTSDGSLGVANPIDAALNELNVDLCVPPTFKSILDEKNFFDEGVKYWWAEGFKDRIKEVAYDKPPFAEYIDWWGDWRVNPPGWKGGPPGWGGRTPGLGAGTRGAPASLEERLRRLEELVGGQTRYGPAGAAPFAPQATACIDFGSLPLGPRPNPFSSSGAQFEVFDYTGAAVPNTRIVGWGGLPGLDANYQTVITHHPCPEVEITLIHYSQPARVTAYNMSGGVVASAAMTVPQGTEQTLSLSGGEIVRVEVDAPQNEVIIRRYCHCAPAKNPIKEKFENKEFKEFWKEKPEILEGKKFKELKEKELKEFKEKEKELKEKEKDLKEKEKELKEIYEGFERPPRQPGVQPPPGGQAPGLPSTGPRGGGRVASLEERLARLEAALGQSHFIGEHLRPDLSRGSLQNEPGCC